MRAQRVRHDRARFLGRLRIACAGAEIAQDDDSALGHNPGGDFMDRRQDTANAARHGFVGNGAIRDGEMGFFDEPVAVDLEEDVFIPRRGAALEWRIDERLEHVPDLAPALTHGLTERRRMLRAEDWAIRIVVDGDVVGTPP